MYQQMPVQTQYGVQPPGGYQLNQAPHGGGPPNLSGPPMNRPNKPVNDTNVPQQPGQMPPNPLQSQMPPPQPSNYPQHNSIPPQSSYPPLDHMRPASGPSQPPRMPMTAQPGGPQGQQNPQNMYPGGGYPPGAASLPTMKPQQPQPGPGMPPMPTQPNTNAHPTSLNAPMENLNINGQPPRPPMSQQMPPTAAPPMMGGPPVSQGGLPQGYPTTRYPTINGVSGPMPPQSMNGVPEPSGPGRGPMPPAPGMQGYPPTSAPMDKMRGGYMPPANQPGAYPQQNYPPQNYPPQQQQQPLYPAQQPSGYPNQAAPKKLDPDHMPSPMQVMQDDQKTKSGPFCTNLKGQLPPLVTTDFIVQDQGNCSPRFMRSTMYNIPISQEIMKQTAVPFGLVISPMAEILEEEQPPPIVDTGEMGPVRCLRCKAYMSPNMQFIDGGRRFQCLLCKATTEVPAEYFQHLDHVGMRVDRFERAELVLGTYEFIAPKEYCRDSIPPKPPAVIFILDVSYNNIKSGLVSLMCSQMKNFLSRLPKERGQTRSSMRVGFITYNSSVHFCNLNPKLGQPQMLVVGDVHEIFIPLLEGFLVDPVESETLIDLLMQQIPTMFAETRETETILAPAIQAGMEALKAAGCAGKLLVFHSSLPICDAPGKLNNRDDRKLLGTDKERSVLTPQNTVYNNLGQDCAGVGCGVDLFVFNNAFVDLATIGQVSRLTGGNIFKYTYFQADLDGHRLIADVEKNISKMCAFDAIMRVRTSTGIRATDFYGHFFMSNTNDIELPALDPDKAVAVEIKHDDKLTEEEGAYIQAALLYTSVSGQRRIRIMNLALKACSQMAELFRTSELDTLMNFLSKQAVYRLTQSNPKEVKKNLITQSAQILACYRKNCAAATSAGQLILPECLKLLPLYMNCLLKNDAISGGSDMTIDDRWFVMAALNTMDIPSSLNFIYPRLLALHNMEGDTPNCVRCSIEKMADNGVYLLENGIYMFLWLGLSVSSEWVMNVFGVPSVAQIDTDKNRLPALNNPTSEKIRGVIDSICSSKQRSMRLSIVRQMDKLEVVMKHFLVEDRGIDGSSSYVDFLCHLHKEIRDLLS